MLVSIRENLKEHWVAFMFGILLISVSAFLLVDNFLFFGDRLFEILIIVLMFGMTVIAGSALKPKKEICTTAPSQPTAGHVLNDENLVTQYEQNQENQRALLKALWEIPTIAIAISTAFLVASYNFFPDETLSAGVLIKSSINPLIRSILLFFGFLLMFVVFLAVIKHRHFRGVWLEYQKKLEAQLGLIQVPMDTDATKDTRIYQKTLPFHKLFLDLRAERWLANVLFLISMVFLSFSIFDFYQYLIGL